MNAREKNKKEMLQAVSEFYESEKDAFTGLPGVIAAFSDLGLINKEIDLNLKVIKEGIKGKIVSKDNSQDELIKMSLVFAGAVYGYAAVSNDFELLTFMDISSTSFYNLRDAEIPLLAEKILDKADALGAALIPYGISEEKRTNARAMLNDYLQKFGSVSTGRGSKKSATETNDMLLVKMEKKFKALDRLMLGFKEGSPELYSRYNASRVVYDKRGARRGGNGTTPPAPPTPEG